MPFTYIHLISFGSSIYCCVFALHKGLAFAPKETYIYGMVIPLFTVALMNISLIGLIAIGQALANPLGGDSEDFAVLSFLESALQRSRQMLDANPAVPTEDDEAYTNHACSRADLSGKRRVSALTAHVDSACLH
jgi:predicted membrane chloride channel (bestrophin family)